MKNLVIVESPAKKKPIEKYLGKDFEVKASYGHIRDLPSKNGSVIPEEDFKLKYDFTEKGVKHVEEIVKAAKKADVVYLATDPDREGESIAWHVAEALRERNLVKHDNFLRRVSFNEITKRAIVEGVQNYRSVDINLVNAQQARRALDYLVGFTLSPVLWRKLPGCKSAGRVQSVALKLICEREDSIERFKTQEYWDITLDFLNEKNEKFSAKLSAVNGKKLDKFDINNKAAADSLVNELNDKEFFVAAIEKKQQKRQPSPPFITSSLQQEAARKLNFSAKKTMQLAQKLYEGVDIDGEVVGLITYMRTDGLSLSREAVENIRRLIMGEFGNDYLPEKPKIYKSKAKNAQEAHEAIRPTDIALPLKKLTQILEPDLYNLYELIWKRTMACQMQDAILDLVGITIDSKDKQFSCRATGSTIAFDGFYKIYREGLDDQKAEENTLLPQLAQSEALETKSIKPLQHFTEPPPRYSEATLVKKLEELGIGRPSTYASILSVLQERNYVTLAKKRFTPSELGRLVTAFLSDFFEKYVEYNFTADLENRLDEVADGHLDWKKLLQDFWGDFNSNIEEVKQKSITEVIAQVEASLDYHLFGDAEQDSEKRICQSCKTGKLSLKLSKFGAFIGCNNYPECNFRKPIMAEESGEVAANGEGQISFEDNNKLLGQDYNGVDIYLKKGPYGLYLQLGEQNPDSPKEKPKRAALPSGVVPANISLDFAIKLLSMPYLVAHYPETGKEILLGIGKYGPYLKYDSQFISIPKSVEPFAITEQQAVDIVTAGLAKPKKPRKFAKGKGAKTDSGAIDTEEAGPESGGREEGGSKKTKKAATTKKETPAKTKSSAKVKTSSMEKVTKTTRAKKDAK